MMKLMGDSVIDQLDRFGPVQCEALSLGESQAYVAELARSHYENFTVVSWLLPKRLREHFRYVYAFCRWADDLGDETGDRQRSRELLHWWRDELDKCYAGEPRHPVYIALQPTVKQFDIPRKPFDDLIDAFLQDQDKTRYDTWSEVIDYCTRSANPVGRLVLYLCGYRDAERQRLSDATCTALQLANFWQDVRRDVIERDRVYIPREVAIEHGLDIDTMAKAIAIDAQREPHCHACSSEGPPSAGIHALRPAYRKTMRALVDRTWPLFEEGRGLWPSVTADVRTDIALFTLGGEAILRMIERQGFDTLSRRPSLGKAAKLWLMGRAAVGKVMGMMRGGGGDDGATRPGSRVREENSAA